MTTAAIHGHFHLPGRTVALRQGALRTAATPERPNADPTDAVIPREVDHPHDPAWKRVIDHVLHSTHVGLEVAQTTHIIAGAVVGGVIGHGLVSVGLTTLGLTHVADGIRNKSGEQVLEGVSGTLVGVKAGLESLVLGTEHATGIVGDIAHTAHDVLKPLGFVHGGLELALGARRVHRGLRHKQTGELVGGALSLGLGTSICAAAMGAGLPAVVASGAFLAGRIAWEEGRRILQSPAPPTSTAGHAPGTVTH